MCVRISYYSHQLEKQTTKTNKQSRTPSFMIAASIDWRIFFTWKSPLSTIQFLLNPYSANFSRAYCRNIKNLNLNIKLAPKSYGIDSHGLSQFTLQASIFQLSLFSFLERKKLFLILHFIKDMECTGVPQSTWLTWY